jgi:hypothetical protein
MNRYAILNRMKEYPDSWHEATPVRLSWEISEFVADGSIQKKIDKALNLYKKIEQHPYGTLPLEQVAEALWGIVGGEKSAVTPDLIQKAIRATFRKREES